MKTIKSFNKYLIENYLENDSIGYDIGEFLYHVTTKNNLDKIKNDGFIPKSGMSINNKPFENRLYFATSLISAYDLSVNFGSTKGYQDYVIIKVDSSFIKDYKLDPLFPHGIYVDYSISSNYIIDILDVDKLFNKFKEEDIENLY